MAQTALSAAAPKSAEPERRAANGNTPALQTGSLYALVVGVSSYTDKKVPQLDLADKDAESFGQFLETQKEIFKDVKVTFLLNEKATKLEIEKYLFYTLPKAGKDDTIVLFFSGHGAFDPIRPDDFMFLPYDTETDYIGATSVKMSGLDFLKGISAERVLIIADACYAGGFTDMKAKSLVPSMETFMKEIRNSSGRAIITSAKPEQLSWENPKLKNSIFTNNFLEGLRGKADRDHDGIVTLNEAYEYAYSKTKDDTQGRQHPQFEGKMVGAFPLSYVGPRIPQAELKKRLLRAAETGDPAAMEQILPRLADVDVRDEDNNTPLILAARKGSVETVKMLLAKGSDRDAANNKRATALSYAAEKGDFDMCRVLIDGGASVNTKTGEGKSPLILAAAGGHRNIVDILLQEGADVKNRTNNGETALSLAAQSGSADTVKTLLKWSDSLGIEDINSEGALINACRGGHAEAVKHLITKNPPVKVSGGIPERKLMLSVLRGDAKRATDELQNGANPLCMLETGDTPLSLAACLGYKDIVGLMMNRNVNPDFMGANNRTPIMEAAANGHAEILGILAKAGAEINAMDKNGATALIITAGAGELRSARTLAELGANLELRDAEGASALFKSAQLGKADMVKFLLSKGADPESQDKNGNTPLTISAANGHAGIVNILVRSADINARNQQKSTALILAAKYGHKDIVRLLLNQGADVSLEDWEGKSALTVAQERDRDEIVTMLRESKMKAEHKQ